MKRWHWCMLGLVWFGVSGALTACQHDHDAQAAPAAPAPHLSPLEKDVVQEINLARTQPKAYATFLEQLKPNDVGDLAQPSGERTRSTKGGETTLVTAEGPKALHEAMAFLRSTSPLPPLEVSKGMSLGARTHVQELESTGAISHQGRDGSRPGDRVNRYGRWQGTIGENIFYGMGSARAMTMALIIDDGVPGRGHRQNIFAPQAGVLGVACSNRVTGQILCVTTFAASYTEGAH